MESLISIDCKPDLKNVIFIEGLPGVGNVGKIAADFVSYKLKSKRMATIITSELPSQVLVDQENYGYIVSNELWYVKDISGHDIIFLLGDLQSSTPQGQFEMCKLIFEKVIPYDPQLVITLGGYGLGEVVKDPRVLGAVNDSKLKTKLSKKGVTFQPGEPQGGIVGAAALFVAFATEYDIPAACLMGETSGFLVDHKSARCVVNMICNILEIGIDTSDMEGDVAQIEMINDEVQAMAESSPEDLSYFR